MSRLARVLALSLIGLALVAVPSAAPAFAGVIDYGAIAKCRYNVTEGGTYGWTEALLKRIVLQPPTVAKVAGTKSVGWRFVVERSLDRAAPPWVVIYRSPRQRANSSAGFAPMRVAVNVPQEDATPHGRSAIWYRVTLKMFWYRADGSVQTKVSHLMNDMRLIVAGEELIDSYCPGLAQQWFN